MNTGLCSWIPGLPLRGAAEWRLVIASKRNRVAGSRALLSLTFASRRDSFAGMIVLREMRRRGKALVGPMLGIVLTGYFAYHLVEGERGLRAWVRLTQELRLAKEQLTGVAAERAEIEHRVSHMRPNQVDPDLLDAQVRKTLDVLRPDEIVIIAAPEKR